VNPTALMLAGGWMLDHAGFAEAGRRVEAAVEAVYAEGRTLPEDQGGAATTEQFTEAVLGRL
jgi:isocitrate dehydrogenase (NAD+)